MTASSDHLHHLLARLYAPAAAAACAEQLRARLDRQPPTGPGPRASLALTQRDALLITYADQVTAPGEAPLATLACFAEQRLTDVVTGIHLLPFYPWSSDDGFAVKDFFAVDPALGGWPDIERLGTRFALMFDAVFNHLSAGSDWFQRFQAGDPAFRRYFVTVDGDPDLSAVVRPRALPLLTEFATAEGPRRVWTTFSADQVDLDVRQPEVLLALVDALLFYVAHGARFIRLDAIAYLWKEIGTPCIHLPQTHVIIQLLRAVLDETAPHVLLITETNVPHGDNVSYFGNGTNEAQLVYNFALPPLVLHTLATGNAARLTTWAQSLRPPSNQVTFFNFLASHDGIGVNPARDILSPEEVDALVERARQHGGRVSYKHNRDGSSSPYELNVNYFDALSDPAGNEARETQVDRFIVAHAIMLALAGLPGIYFHSLFGSRNDREGAERSGIPRRINRQKLRAADLAAELADPGSLRCQVFHRLRDWLRRRAAHPAFKPTAPQEILALHPGVFAVRRTSVEGADSMLCLHNVTNAEVIVSGSHLGQAGNCRLRPYEVCWCEV